MRITDASEFYSLVSNVNSGTNYSGTTVFLDHDLSLSGYDIDYNANAFTKKQFIGTFDGQGHVISDFKMNSSSQYVSLFGYSTGLTIRNVVLDSSCSVTSSYTSTNAHVGGIIGACIPTSAQCTIENNVNMATITFKGSLKDRFTKLYIGGIAGFLGFASFPSSSSSKYETVMKNCVNYGNIFQSGSGGITYIGGLVGYSYGSASNYVYIQNCLDAGTRIHTKSAYSNSLTSGGIIGYSYYTKIENCVSTGSFIHVASSTTSNSYIGTIVGDASSFTNMTHSFWTIVDYGYRMYGTYSDNITVNKVNPAKVNSTYVDELNSYSEDNSWSRWLLNENSTSVTFKINNGKSFNASSHFVLIPNIADNDERTFSGWYNDKLLSLPFSNNTIESEITIYGMFCGSNYTVTLDANGGDELDENERKFTIECNGTYKALPEGATKFEAAFAGWFTEKEGGDKIELGDRVDNYNNHTLYAQWIINNYTLTFIFNNGAELEARVLDFNASIVYPENVTRAGYNLSGWENGVEFMPGNDLTITAQWRANNYTATFDVAGGNELSGATKKVTFDSTYGELPTPTRAGYVFLGWFTKTNESTTETSVVSTPDDHTLYAHWEKVTEHVEIVFGSKGMTKEEIINLIEQHTSADYEVVSLGGNDESEGTRVIIKFTDEEDAKTFYQSITASNRIVRAAFTRYDASISPTTYPLSAFIGSIFLFLSNF